MAEVFMREMFLFKNFQTSLISANDNNDFKKKKVKSGSSSFQNQNQKIVWSIFYNYNIATKVFL